jgi:hypothetical protein
MADNASFYVNQFREADTNISSTDDFAKAATVPKHLGERLSFDEPAHGCEPADSKNQQSKNSIKKMKQLQAYLERRQHKRQREKEARKARTEAERLRFQSLSASEQERLARELAERERVRREQRAEFLRARDAALLRRGGAAQRVAINYSYGELMTDGEARSLA